MFQDRQIDHLYFIIVCTVICCDVFSLTCEADGKFPHLWAIKIIYLSTKIMQHTMLHPEILETWFYNEILEIWFWKKYRSWTGIEVKVSVPALELKIFQCCPARGLILTNHGRVGGWAWSFAAAQFYLLGGEAGDELGYIVPVYGLGHSPQRAEHHVQNQDVVIIRKVVVVRAEATHLCKVRERRHRHQGVEKKI